MNERDAGDRIEAALNKVLRSTKDDNARSGRYGVDQRVYGCGDRLTLKTRSATMFVADLIHRR